jgi:hypothetical protein
MRSTISVISGPRLRHDQAALPLPDRGHQLHHPRGDIVAARRFEPDFLHRIQRRQVIKENLVARDLRILEVDFFHLEHREVAFALFGRTDLTRNHVAGAEVEPPNLRRRNINVVRTRQVVVIGRTQEAEPVLERLEDPFAVDGSVFLRLSLKNGEDQLLLAQVARAFDLQILGDFVEVVDRLLF